LERIQIRKRKKSSIALCGFHPLWNSPILKGNQKRNLRLSEEEVKVQQIKLMYKERIWKTNSEDHQEKNRKHFCNFYFLGKIDFEMF
jgi:hypothetical protein